MAPSIFNRLNISVFIRALLSLYNLALKLFSKKTLEAYRPLLTVSKIGLGKTHNIS